MNLVREQNYFASLSDAYLDELEWRFNNRDNPYLFRDTLLKLIQAENLPYHDLVSENESP